MEMIKSPHPYRKNGFYLTFPNGHVWSCVNLGKNDFLNEKIPDNFNDEINKIFERIGRFYDTSSGRYEAMIVTKIRSEEHTSELQSQSNLVCRLLLEKKK